MNVTIENRITTCDYDTLHGRSNPPATFDSEQAAQK